MTTTQRAQLALCIINGKAPLPKLSKALIAHACGVSVSSIYRLQNGGGDRRPLADRLAKATPAERVEAARALGPERVWAEMVMPLI